MMGVLDGKVILVTGAGRGIGQACALLVAQEGARVVVNDLGASVSGEGRSSSPAEDTVKMIVEKGGEAVANNESVTNMNAVEGMLKQALEAFGGLHGVISPAGILRDGMFHKMTEKDWDDVIEVHLKGTFNITRTMVEHFRQQEEGSFVLFTSTSGLIGNVGQANYAAAKMGIAGLSRLVALEGLRKKVRSNAIAPFAWTRMIESIPVKDAEAEKRVERMRTGMRPEQVAQLAIALVSPLCNLSGQVFIARGNEIMLMNQPRPVSHMTRPDGWTPKTLLEHACPAFEAQALPLVDTNSVLTWDAL